MQESTKKRLRMLKDSLKILFGAGIALMMEHIISKGYFNLELIGHETYGLIAVIISVLLLGVIRKKES